jgi:glycosyltransferase involved in cell wall biosynthesis
MLAVLATSGQPKGEILFVSDFPLGHPNPEAERKLAGFAERGWDGVYVEKIGIRDPSPRHAATVLRRLSGNLPAAAERALPFRTVSPRLLPPRRLRPVARLNRAWLKRQLLPSLRDPAAAIAWVRYPSPEIVDLLDDMNPRLVVYEEVDRHPESPGLSRRLRTAVERAERRLLERADVVFAWSEPIRSALARVRDDVILAPPAVDLDLLRAVAAREPDERVAAYAGSLDFRFDAELVAQVAERLPQWRFVLTGAVIDPGIERRLAPVENVELRGRVAPEEVAAALEPAAVCLMPYRRDDFTDTLFPIKLVEYLAAGRPVVSTGIAAASEFGDEVRVADDPARFAEAIERAAAADSPGARSARTELAAPYSWDARIDQMEAAIESALARSR